MGDNNIKGMKFRNSRTIPFRTISNNSIIVNILTTKNFLSIHLLRILSYHTCVDNKFQKYTKYIKTTKKEITRKKEIISLVGGRYKCKWTRNFQTEDIIGSGINIVGVKLSRFREIRHSILDEHSSMFLYVFCIVII